MSWTDFSDNFSPLARSLSLANRHGRIGQAYLLQGDDAPFLTRYALGFAQMAACRQPRVDGSPCLECTYCRQFQHHSYNELQRLEPQSKSRQITVDAMRRFDYALSLSAPAGNLKIGLICEADCLGEEAQNAFLKTLEEPPPRTLLLLTTIRPRRILPTIRSRCQTLFLLWNRRRYDTALSLGLFNLLAPLKRQAGVRIALDTSAQISQILGDLRTLAEESVNANWDERWESSAEDNRSLRKQLDELKTVQIESEYIRRRDEMTEAIHTWFLQRYLQAAGIAANLLPHPELVQDLDSLPPPAAPEECSQDVAWTETSQLPESQCRRESGTRFSLPLHLRKNHPITLTASSGAQRQTGVNNRWLSLLFSKSSGIVVFCQFHTSKSGLAIYIIISNFFSCTISIPLLELAYATIANSQYRHHRAR